MDLLEGRLLCEPQDDPSIGKNADLWNGLVVGEVPTIDLPGFTCRTALRSQNGRDFDHRDAKRRLPVDRLDQSEGD